ncbi:multidrug transporter subunit MdtN [Acidomonas methanolica]|uniref:multidrug transporter subunit MdtN n=1 Tax=Acidomonas methanolica TaxID=437 RepID=UPI002119F99D|nr:multidrug transporter subunit MdtN [Acidomonas methanolica]MCQ9157115.1 multidrug transporter subunit MdtN [Acidomonas methanolica]
MDKVSTVRRRPVGKIIAIVCIGVAILYGVHVARVDHAHPSTDDGSLDAEVVHVASTVGGRLIDLRVDLNQHVRRGDLLYRLDPRPYELVVAQAAANLALAEAEVANQQRAVGVKEANVVAASQGVLRARADRDLAARTVDRLRPLSASHYIPLQEYDTAQTALHNAETALVQAQQASAAAQIAVGDLNSSIAARDAARAALDHARYELEQTTVYASQDGYVTSLHVKTGEILAPAQALFTLIADDQWYAVGNFRENDLHAIRIGDCATVYSMIDRHTPIRGVVRSIGRGVASLDSADLARGLPIVAREMDWVHVAQRFPVRIGLNGRHPDLLRVGATSSITVGSGPACR